MDIDDPTLQPRVLALARASRLPVDSGHLADVLDANPEQTAHAVVNLHDAGRLRAAVEGGCASATVMEVY